MNPDIKPGYMTTEFYLAIAGKVISALALFGVLNASDAQMLGDSLGRIAAAVAIVVANSWMVVNYIRGRVAQKMAPPVLAAPPDARKAPPLLPMLILALLGLAAFETLADAQMLPWRRQAEQRLKNLEAHLSQPQQAAPAPQPIIIHAPQQQAPAPSGPPQISAPGLPIYQIPQGPILLQPSPPQQVLPIAGPIQQVLPIAGPIQQQLPIQGPLQQQLPQQGPIQQQLPGPGTPQQSLPIQGPIQGQPAPQQQAAPMPAPVPSPQQAAPTPAPASPAGPDILPAPQQQLPLKRGQPQRLSNTRYAIWPPRE